MSLTEGISGVRAKKFFSETLYSLFDKFSKIIPNWEEQLEHLIIESYNNNMGSSTTPKVHDINSFLRWIGFSPVELNWNEDMKIGRMFFSTNVLWQSDPVNDKIVRIVVKSLAKAIGTQYIGSEPHLVFIDENKLPPRYKVGIRFVDKSEAISSKIDHAMEATSLSMGNHVFDPILTPSIDPEFASKAFIEGSIELIKETYPTEWVTLGQELQEVPSKLLLFLYKKASIESALKDVGNQLGKIIADKIKEKYKDFKPYKVIKGIGLMPINTITDLMSYGSPTLCNNSKNVDFCVFMTHIWSVIISEFLGQAFMPEIPLCATSSSNVCIYTFKKMDTN